MVRIIKAVHNLLFYYRQLSPYVRDVYGFSAPLPRLMERKEVFLDIV
jgi:hypothetical protein